MKVLSVNVAVILIAGVASLFGHAESLQTMSLHGSHVGRQFCFKAQTSDLVPEPVSLTAFPTTRTSSATTPSDIYLCSLLWTPDERISKPCRDLWKWKDSALGDGRDFFVPKPKTIAALQRILREQCGLSQVSVLSNCARLEILCVCNENPLLEISRCFMAQVFVSKKQSNPFMTLLSQSFDLPDSLTVPDSKVMHAIEAEANELAKHWDVENDSEEILRHLCWVSAGMASRPRRPDREVVFRPFSSRDAHILLQLKRTKEVAEGQRVHKLLEYALRAGKAARNVDIVPALSRLKEYGTGDSKYSVETPKDVLVDVCRAVECQAIQPLVSEYLQSTGVTENLSITIAQFRKAAESLALNNDERLWVRKRLHEPTVQIRSGSLRMVSIQSALHQIERDLEGWRKQGLPERLS